MGLEKAENDIRRDSLRLSIVVVTYNNEPHIEQALRSCEHLDANFFEVIVVHNASTDKTGEVISKIASAKPDLFRVVNNSSNVGLGFARNIGIKKATGDYIMFLDGDDWFEPAMLDELLSEVQKRDEDLFLFSFLRDYPDGHSIPNTHLNTILSANDVETRLTLVDFLNVAWNKAIRREFLLKHELWFPDGFYEDIEWNFKVLSLAKTVRAYPFLLVHYRQRPGSILRKQDPRHFDILDQYEALLDFLKKNEEIARLYGEKIFYRSKRHLYWLSKVKDRVPDERKPEFLMKSAAIMKRYRQVLNVEPLEGTAIDHAAARGNVKLVRLMRNWKKIRLRKKNKRAPRMLLRKAAYKIIFCRLPVDKNKIIYDSFWGQQIGCSPYSIYRCAQNVPELNHVWLTEQPKNQFGARTKYVRPKSWAYYWHMARAKYHVTNTNPPGFLRKSKNKIILQTFHGTPLKSMGLDMRWRQPTGMSWGGFSKRCGKVDVAISSNSYSSEIWRKTIPGDYKIIECGYPRNDVFFNDKHEDWNRVIADRYCLPRGKKLALYAPTFRDWDKSNQTLENALDLGKLAAALGDEYCLLYRGHYFATGHFDTSLATDVSDYPVSNEICMAADMLITDYSSIMFDYACLKRPIVLYTPDYEEYRLRRGTYFDLPDCSPGPIAENPEDMYSIIKNREYDSSESKELLTQFNKKFCAFDDGHASERALEEAFGIKVRQ